MLKKLLSCILAAVMVMSMSLCVSAWEPITDVAKIRVGMFSDTHITQKTGISRITSMVDAFEAIDPELDGLAMIGDIVYMAGSSQTDLTDADSAVYDELVASDFFKKYKEKNALVYTMGNHEYIQDYSGVVQQNYIDKFTEKTGFTRNSDTVIGGFHFISAGASSYQTQFTAEDEEYYRSIIDASIAENPNRPVFFTIHYPIEHTVLNTSKPFHAANFSAEFEEYIKSKPQVVVISGHIHNPENDPRCIHQEKGGFTAIQTSQVASNSIAQGITLEVTEDNIVTIRRVDALNGGFIGSPWVLNIPQMVAGDESQYIYTNDRYTTSDAPVFPENAAIIVDNITSESASFTFTQATSKTAGDENSLAKAYRIKKINLDTYQVEGNVVITSDYTLLSREQTLRQSVLDLSPNTNYRIEINAISPFDKESALIYADFKTEAVEEEEVFEPVDFIDEPITKLASEGTNSGSGYINDSSTAYWGLSNNASVTHTFNVTAETVGKYRVYGEFGSEGAVMSVTVDGVSVSKNFNTGHMGNYTQVIAGDFIFREGNHTITVKNLSSISIGYKNISIQRFAEIAPTDGYTLSSETKDENCTVSASGYGTSVGGQIMNSSFAHYAEWKLTPAYSAIYKISLLCGVQTNANIKLTVNGEVINTVSLTSETNPYNSANDDSYSVFAEFGEVELKNDAENTIRVSMAGGTGYVDVRDIKVYYDREIPYSFTKKLGDIDNVSGVKLASGAQLSVNSTNTDLTVKDNNKIIWSITPEQSGIYDLEFKYAHTSSAVDESTLKSKVYVNGVETFNYSSTEAIGINNAKYHKYGQIRMAAGTTYKIRFDFTESTSQYLNLFGLKATKVGEIPYTINKILGETVANRPTNSILTDDAGTYYTFAYGHKVYTTTTSQEVGKDDFDKVVWSITPEQSGEYDLSFNVNTRGSEAKAEVYVNAHCDLAKTFTTASSQYVNFGKIYMNAGEEYKVQFSYVDGPTTITIGNINLEKTRGYGMIGDVYTSYVGDSTDNSGNGVGFTAYGDGRKLLFAYDMYNNGYVSFDFDLPIDGKYKIYVRAASNSATEYKVESGAISFNNTFGGPANINAYPIEEEIGIVNLKAGVNSIKVTQTAGNALRLYAVRLVNIGEYESDVISIKTGQPDDYYTGDGVIGPQYEWAFVELYGKGYVEYNFEADAGNYNVFINYACLNHDGKVKLYVNGIDYGDTLLERNNVPTSAALDTLTKINLATVKLKDGKNVVRLAVPSDGQSYGCRMISFEAIDAPVLELFAGDYVDPASECSAVSAGSTTFKISMPKNRSGENGTAIAAIYSGNELYKTALVPYSVLNDTLIPITIKGIAEGTYTYKIMFVDSIDTLRPNSAYIN